jgi:uncharacterized damage-inducible protein DinB
MPFQNPVTRTMPPLVAAEPVALRAQLDFHRATILAKLNGLDDEQAARAMVPSGVSLLSLLKHLTSDEVFWFGQVFAGEPAREGHEEGADWRLEPGDTIDGLAAAYLAACERSREIVAGAASYDERTTTPWGEEIDLRGIMVHMIEETARHNGHADILRELLDGTTGF